MGDTQGPMQARKTTVDASPGADSAATAERRPRCTVAIPTFRRPERLRAAIASVRAQAGMDPSDYEILIVDNSPEGSAAGIVKAFPVDGPASRYVHETGPGPAHARNRAVAEARGELLAFLDDDETAAPNWLSALIGTLETSNADAAFGKVEARFDLPPARHGSFAAEIYSRDIHVASGADVGARHAGLGTGNSIYRVSRCFAEAEPFPAKVATSGGEDTVFLRRLVSAGRRLAWAPEAIALEHVPADRVRPDSLRARRFRQGQLRALACLEGKPPDFLGVAFWMAAGTAQALKAAAFNQALRLLGQEERAERAGFDLAGGLGKVLWWVGSPTIYGVAESPDGASSLRPKTQNFS